MGRADHKFHNNTFEGFMQSVQLARKAIWSASFGNAPRNPRYEALSVYLHARGVGTKELVLHGDETRYWQKVWKADRLPSKAHFKPVYMHKIREYLVQAQQAGRFDPESGVLLDAVATPIPTTNGHTGHTSTGSGQPQRMRDAAATAPVQQPVATAAPTGADVIAQALEQLTAQQIIDIIQDELTVGAEAQAQVVELQNHMVESGHHLLEATREANHWREEATRLQNRVNQLGSQLGNADLDYQKLQEQLAEVQEQAAQSDNRGSLRLFTRGRRA